jgi:DNA repair exonuclease SbcCD ATPase subunit
MQNPGMGTSHWQKMLRDPHTILMGEDVLSGLQKSIENRAVARNTKIEKGIRELQNISSTSSREMKHMDLCYIEFEGLLCFASKSSFNFDELRGNTVLISAPNGFGKTSFIEIICLALFGNGIKSRSSTAKAASSIISNGLLPGQVPTTYIEFKLNGEKFAIRRQWKATKTGVTSHTKVLYDSPVEGDGTKRVLAQKKEMDTWVAKNLGDIDQFLLTVIMSQNQDMDFFDMNPKTQADTLNKVFNFDTIHALTEILKEGKNAYTDIISHVRTAIEAIHIVPFQEGDIEAYDLEIIKTRESIDSIVIIVDEISEDIRKIEGTSVFGGVKTIRAAEEQITSLEKELAEIPDVCGGEKYLFVREGTLTSQINDLKASITSRGGVPRKASMFTCEPPCRSQDRVYSNEPSSSTLINRINEIKILERDGEKTQDGMEYNVSRDLGYLEVLALRTSERIASREKNQRISKPVQCIKSIADEIEDQVNIAMRIRTAIDVVQTKTIELGNNDFLCFKTVDEALPMMNIVQHLEVDADVIEESVKSLRAQSKGVERKKECDKHLESFETLCRSKSIANMKGFLKEGVEKERKRLKNTLIGNRLLEQAAERKKTIPYLRRKIAWEKWDILRLGNLLLTLRKELDENMLRLKDIKRREDVILRIKDLEAFVKCVPLKEKKKSLVSSLSDSRSALETSSVGRIDAMRRKSEHRHAVKKQNDLMGCLSILSAKQDALQIVSFKFDDYKCWVMDAIIPKIHNTSNGLMKLVNSDLELSSTMDGSVIQWFVKKKNDRISIDKCSGFERFMIGIVFRISLQFLGVTGMTCGTYIIDEGFVSCDSIHIQRVPIFIRTLSTMFDTVITVSHLQTIEDSVDVKIRIAKTTDGRSSILVKNVM